MRLPIGPIDSNLGPISATLPTRSHSACRWSHFTTSTAVIIFICGSALLVPVTRRTTLGDREFAIAGPRAWNTLPDFITDCSSSRTFKQFYLKTYLFSLSFWAIINTSFYDYVKRTSSSLCRLRRFKIVFFTLHYITILPRLRDIAGFLRRANPPLFHPNFRGIPLGLDCRCCDFEERRH